MLNYAENNDICLRGSFFAAHCSYYSNKNGDIFIGPQCSAVFHIVLFVFFSRKGEVLCSRKDFQMNSVCVDKSSGSVVLDVQSLSLIQMQAVQQQQQPQYQTRYAES